MKKIVTLFFQVVVVLIGFGVLAFLLWEPQVEGVNAHATFFEIYFNDFFLAYAYLASLSFFAALYQAFKLLGYARQNKLFSQPALKALRTIKYCAIALIGFVFVGEIILAMGESDDRAGGVFMGVLISFVSILMASSAALFERHVHKAMTQKPENDVGSAEN